MRVTKSFFAFAFVAVVAAPLEARSFSDPANDANAGGSALPAFGQPQGPAPLECVPYARMTSGIQIYGDAHTWWGQAKGRYATGRTPRVGAVMAVDPFNNSHLGHVATVSRVVDSRTILLSHANWSYRGGIERNVTALDVSPGNDWSQVRIWYGPAHNLGTTHWPVRGFIYNARPGSVKDIGPAIDRGFSQDLGSARLAALAKPAATPVRALAARTPAKAEAPVATGRARAGDPLTRIISGRY